MSAIQFKRYELPQLPYKVDALEPYISASIIDVHYNGHHKGYVNGFNATLDKLEKILKGEATGYDIQGIIKSLTFNSNGHKLHAIYWNNMAPAGKGGGKPGGKLADLIDKQFGGFEKFKAIFSEEQKSLPGTGWTALYYDVETKNLVPITVENHFMNHLAEQPIVLIVDEFEHAYYLQYKNNRNAYLDAWWNIVNWDDAEKRLSKYL